MVDTIIAIDPGREKCGLAVLNRQQGVKEKSVVPSAELIANIKVYCLRYQVQAIILGDGTSSAEKAVHIQEILNKQTDKNITLHMIDEYKSTELARTRYWQEHPPSGWQRLIPVTMQVPPVPVDDYVAVLLGEKYFKNNL
jgi:RNase H-fold protein (predicted Holliday junction resolvase)